MKLPDVVWHRSPVRQEARASRGATLWFTGLPGSGKSTLAHTVESRLVRSGLPAYVLDGDSLRHGNNGDLGFSPPTATRTFAVPWRSPAWWRTPA